MNARYQAGPDTFVVVDYQVFDAEGDPVMTGTSRLGFVFGRGQLLPAIERALDGRWAGEPCTLVLRPDEAFGRRDPRALLDVDRSEFPDNVAPGDRFEVENEAGALLVLQVLDVGPEAVQLDLNHPLAGQELRVELVVVEVRPATEAERKEADRMREAAGEAPPGEVISLPGPVLPVESLLRGPGRRYERGPADETPASLEPGDIDEH